MQTTCRARTLFLKANNAPLLKFETLKFIVFEHEMFINLWKRYFGTQGFSGIDFGLKYFSYWEVETRRDGTKEQFIALL